LRLQTCMEFHSFAIQIIFSLYMTFFLPFYLFSLHVETNYTKLPYCIFYMSNRAETMATTVAALTLAVTSGGSRIDPRGGCKHMS
jgi:hypothetical protein